MSVYATRTHGAWVQTKGSSMVFNYSSADPEFGAMQGKELQTTLQHMFADFPVTVRTGKGYVEACHQDVNKGAMAVRMVELLEADGQAVDFVLCAGDDSTDELMFSSLNEKLGKNSSKLFTVTIGRKPSEATRYLDDYQETVSLIELLSSIGFRAPGMALGGGSLGGMSSMTRKTKPGLGGMSSSCTDLTSLG